MTEQCKGERGPEPELRDAAYREAQRAWMAAAVVMALLILAVIVASVCVLSSALAPLLEAAP